MSEILRITDATGLALNFLDDINILEDIGEISREWSKIGSALAALSSMPFSSAPNLMKWLLDNIEKPDVKTAFYDLKLGELWERIDAAKARLVKILPQAPALLAPVGSSPPAIVWQPAVSGALQPATDLSLTFALSGALSVQAGAVWPYKGDGVDQPLLLLAAEADVKADAAFKLPFSSGSLGVAGSAGAKPAAKFYFAEPDPSQAFAAAAAQSLGRMPDPFDPASVWTAFAYHGLVGMVLNFDGHASLAVDLAFGRDFDVPSWLSGKFGATVSIDISQRSQFEMSVRVLPGASHTAGDMQLAVKLSRGSAAAQGVAVGLDLGIDASAIFAKVHDLLQPEFEKVDDLLGQITPFLSPGTWLQDHAQAELNSLIGKLTGDDALHQALLHDAGLLLGKTIEGDDLVQYLTGRIGMAIDSASGDAFGHADALVEEAAAELARVLPSLATSSAQQILKTDLAGLIDGYSNAAEKLAGDLVKASGLAAVESALGKVGARLGAGAKAADKAFAGLRDLITRYQALAKKIVDFTANQAKAKISARIAYEARQSHEEQYVLAGLFHTLEGEAGRLYRSIMFGQLTAVRNAFDTKVAGFEIDEKASSLTHIARIDRSLGYEFLLFGLELSGKDLLSAEAEVRLTQGGTISVAAKGSFERRMKGLGAERSLTFVSTYALMRTRAELAVRPSIGLGLTATHADNSLKLDDVAGFLQRLVEFGLIAPNRQGMAIDTLSTWSGTRGKNVNLPGRISVTQNFNAADVTRLLATGAQIGEAAIPSSKGLDVFRAGIEALVHVGEKRANSLQEGVTAFDYRNDIRPIRSQFGDDVELSYHLAINGRWLQYLDMLAHPPGTKIPAEPRVGEYLDFVGPVASFVDLLGKLYALYTYQPISIDAAATEYRQQEAKIAQDSSGWLKLNRQFIFCFKPEMHRRTIAFFLLLASQARGVPVTTAGKLFDDMFAIKLLRETTGESVDV